MARTRMKIAAKPADGLYEGEFAERIGVGRRRPPCWSSAST
jgi:hypothetical protein